MRDDLILAGQRLNGLYAITDSALMPGDQLFAKTEAALRGGCTILQYRCKSRDPSRLETAKYLRALCHRYGALLMINDDADLALAVNADGLHIGQGDLALAEARRILGSKALIGVTCHADISLALQAEQQGASYVAFGRFFPSHTKPQAPPAPLHILAEAKARLQLPVVAIGGITRDNARLLVEQGVDMIAVIHELFAFDDVENRARQLTRLFHEPI